MAEWGMNSRPTRTVRAARSTSAPTRITATASGTAHTKGAWMEIVASTTFDASVILLALSATFTSATATNVAADVAIGAAGSEQIIAADILCGYLESTGGQTGPAAVAIPYPVPAGSRISVRIQALIVSDTVSVTVDLLGGAGWEGAQAAGPINTYGFAAATTKGVVVTTGTTANVKTAFVDVTTSTLNPHRQLMIRVQSNNRVVTANEFWSVDVGLWNGTSYDVIWPDFPVFYGSSENLVYHWMPNPHLLGYSLPRGSRLGIAASASVAAAVSLDVCLYGMG